MPRTMKLLLTENVDNTGIVGDVVTVRKGYARNFLLPRGFATQPSAERVKQLAGKRAEAEKMLAELRKQREALVGKLHNYAMQMIRSCNDQGILYGAVTQQDLCDALATAGFPGIKPREVRLGSTIKRIDKYEIHVKFDTDLEAVIALTVAPDRKLDLEKDKEEDKPADAKVDGADGKDGKAADGKDGKPAEGKDGKPVDRKPGDRPDRPRRDREDRPRRGSFLDQPIPEAVKGWGPAPPAPAADKKGDAKPEAKSDKGAEKSGDKSGEKPAKAPKAEKAKK